MEKIILCVTRAKEIQVKLENLAISDGGALYSNIYSEQCIELHQELSQLMRDEQILMITEKDGVLNVHVTREKLFELAGELQPYSVKHSINGVIWKHYEACVDAIKLTAVKMEIVEEHKNAQAI